jgi:hypothetical protein
MSWTTFQPRGSSSTIEDFSKQYSRTLKNYSKRLQDYSNYYSRLQRARGLSGILPGYPCKEGRRRTPRGVNSPVTFVASGPCQVAPIHRTGAPPRRTIGRRGDACRRPCRGLSTRACVTGMTSPTHNRPSPTISRPPRPLPRARAQPPPSSAARHWHPPR